MTFGFHKRKEISWLAVSLLGFKYAVPLRVRVP